MKYDVIGIGNPLVDLTVKVENQILEELNIKSGSMNLFADEKLQKLMDMVKDNILKTSPGDSTANTLAGIANFGGNVAYIGKTGDDQYGKMFTDSLIKDNVISKIVKSSESTGKVIAFVTPNTERTFIVNLGASKNLEPSDINPEDIKDSKFLHVTGYQLEDGTPNLKAATLEAMKIAKENDVKVSIDLADAQLIKRNLEFLKTIINKYVYIVFSNEDEAEAFTGMKPEDALEEISKTCNVAVVKIGEGGSYIKSKDNLCKVPIFKVNAVDTTGAGDMYSAGVLYGLSNNLSFAESGKIGAYAASRVVEQYGARLEYSLKEKIKDL